MKILITTIFIFIFCRIAFSQSYALNPTHLNVQGMPGDFMLSTLIVNNPSGAPITMHLKRIVKNLPANWTSCFCYPYCIAPFIDTLVFSISPFSSDSIKPNYGTDSLPGIGYITIILYEEGFQNNLDTITFSGSTMASGINENFINSISVFPNPVTDYLIVSNTSSVPFSVSIFNSLGEMMGEKSYSGTKSVISFNGFPEGYYFIQARFDNGQVISKKIIKSN